MKASVDTDSKLLQVNLTTRPATTSDQSRLILLINTAFERPDAFMAQPRIDLASLEEMMKKGTILMAEDPDGNLVASIYAELRGERGYLGMMAVHPAQRRRGICSRMQDVAEEYLRSHGCKAVDICVLSANPESLAVMRKFGFVETGTEPFDEPDLLLEGHECHRILMSRPLV